MQLLHEFQGVRTVLIRLELDLQVQLHSHPGGEEILVLEGGFADARRMSPRELAAQSSGSATLQRLVQMGPALFKSGHLVAPVLPLPN